MELCLILYIRDARLLTNIPRQHFLAQDFLAQEVLADLQNSVSIESCYRTPVWPRSGWGHIECRH
jgi:4'-phosphopantetheinyl transferase EntD